MRNHFILLSLLGSLTALSACQQVECADGTVERDGRCEPDDGSFNPATCGPFTTLVGDRCVPQFPPTVCEDGTTEPEVDTATGVTTCKGTGVTGGCGTPIACPTPAGASKQTICGQIYNFETNEPFAAAGAMGVACDPAAPAATGPCALAISPYDAVGFARNPSGATPFPHGDITIDDCGRYRVSDIDINGNTGFTGLGVDDAGMPFGAGGVTVTVAAATPARGATAVKDFELWIVKANPTIMGWVASGGPPFSATAGIYAPVFRKHKAATGALRFVGQEGVTVIKDTITIPANDFYFTPAETTRTTIVPAATATGVNGTAFVTNATVDDGLAYNGQGGLGMGCRWEPHAGASIPGIVFVQVFKKIDILGQTCND